MQELFTQVAPVKSVHLPKDKLLHTHMGYGFIEFHTPIDQVYALKVLQGIKLFNQSLKLNKINIGYDLFIKNLDPLVDEHAIRELCQQFGEVGDVKLGKGTAIVGFKEREGMEKALKLDGERFMNKVLKVERKK
jgi:splicing factor 3B subunit 4